MNKCGTCTACCVEPKIIGLPGYNKPKQEGKRCRHLSECAEGSCSIYGSRPQGCKNFECAWTKGLLKEGERPDQLGVYFEFLAPTKIRIVEIKVGAFRSKEVLRIVQRLTYQGFQLEWKRKAS